MTTPTPRTDAEAIGTCGIHSPEMVRSVFARQLERELNETVAALRDLAHYHDADKHDYCRKCGQAFMHPVHIKTSH